MEVLTMSTDNRDVLEVLKAELNFLEKGGYGRSVKTPYLPTLTFIDSLSCVNFAEPTRPHPCSECLLMDFVPSDYASNAIPCHHIPLNAEGVTIQELEKNGDQQNLEELLKDWLRQRIIQLEKTKGGN
jgi:hypothetical protein